MSTAPAASKDVRGHLGLMALGVLLAAITTPFSPLVSNHRWGQWRTLVRRACRVDEFMTRARPAAS
jgi:hypothetical protein